MTQFAVNFRQLLVCLDSQTLLHQINLAAMHTKAFPYIGMLSLFWGTNMVASRFGIREFDPLLFIALRLTIATLFFIPFLFLTGHRLPRETAVWRSAIISGILGVSIPMSTFILSLQYQSSGVASILLTAAPVMMVIAAHLFLPDEKLTRHKGLGVLLALAGTLFLAVRGESGLDVGRASPLGFGLIMIGVTSETANAMFVRQHMKKMDPMTVTGIRLGVGALVLAVITLLVADTSLAEITVTGYVSLGYAALIGALGGQFMAFYVMRRFGATAFSLTAYLIPVVAVILGVLVLDEIVTWGMLVGVVIIGGGIFMINWKGGGNG